jgi:hypothetical protein
LVWPGLMTSIFAPFFNSSAEGTLMICPLTTGVFDAERPKLAEGVEVLL